MLRITTLYSANVDYKNKFNCRCLYSWFSLKSLGRPEFDAIIQLIGFLRLDVKKIILSVGKNPGSRTIGKPMQSLDKPDTQVVQLPNPLILVGHTSLQIHSAPKRCVEAWDRSKAVFSALVPFYSGEMHFYLMRTKEALGELQEAKTLLVKLNYHYEAAGCMLRTARRSAFLGEYDGAFFGRCGWIDSALWTLWLIDESRISLQGSVSEGANVWGEEISALHGWDFQRDRDCDRSWSLAPKYDIAAHFRAKGSEGLQKDP